MCPRVVTVGLHILKHAVRLSPYFYGYRDRSLVVPILKSYSNLMVTGCVRNEIAMNGFTMVLPPCDIM